MATEVKTARHLLRISEVTARTGLERSAIYRLARKDERFRPIKLTERSSAWCSEGIDSWVSERIAASKKVA